MKQQQEFVVCSLCKFLLVKVVVLIGKRHQCVVSLAVGSDPLLLYMYMLYMFLLIWNNIRKCCCEKLWKQVCLFWYDETTTRTAAACCVRRFRALLVNFLYIYIFKKVYCVSVYSLIYLYIVVLRSGLLNDSSLYIITVIYNGNLIPVRCGPWWRIFLFYLIIVIYCTYSNVRESYLFLSPKRTDVVLIFFT